MRPWVYFLVGFLSVAVQGYLAYDVYRQLQYLRDYNKSTWETLGELEGRTKAVEDRLERRENQEGVLVELVRAVNNEVLFLRGKILGGRK